MKIGKVAHKGHRGKSSITGERSIKIGDYSFTNEHASLSILCFNPGDLKADFPDCMLRIGIYGTLFNPIELLDPLIIDRGVNKNSVRLAAQFLWSQEIVDRMVSIGRKFHISSNLTITIKED